MADKHIGALQKAQAVYDDSLFVMEQQGTAMSVTGRQIRSMIGAGSSGGGASWGFIEMETSIPTANRTDNTLYGLILQTY